MKTETKTRATEGTILGVKVLVVAAKVLCAKGKPTLAKTQAALAEVTRDALEEQIRKGSACPECTYGARGWPQIVKHLAGKCNVISPKERRKVLALHEALATRVILKDNSSGRSASVRGWDAKVLSDIEEPVLEAVQTHVVLPEYVQK